MPATRTRHLWSAALATKNDSNLTKIIQEYFAGHTKGFSTHVINTWECCQVPHPPHKTTSMSLNSYLAKIVQKCACHTKRFSTRYLTRRNVTKRNACDKTIHVTSCKTFKNHNFRRFATGTTISSPLRTVADGCQRQATSSEHTSTPSPPKINENPSLCIRELYIYTHKLGSPQLSKCQKYDWKCKRFTHCWWSKSHP